MNMNNKENCAAPTWYCGESIDKCIKNNNEHPELGAGEMFLTNTELKHFCTIGYKSKRMGFTAYNIDGNLINGCYLHPVFVNIKEYNEHMRVVNNSRKGTSLKPLETHDD